MSKFVVPKPKRTRSRSEDIAKLSSSASHSTSPPTVPLPHLEIPQSPQTVPESTSAIYLPSPSPPLNPSPTNSPTSLWSPRLVQLHLLPSKNLQLTYHDYPISKAKFCLDLTLSSAYIAITPYDHHTVPPSLYTVTVFYGEGDKKHGAGKIKLAFEDMGDMEEVRQERS